MKKLLLSIAMMATALSGFATDGKLHVSGKLTGIGDSIYVVTVDFATGQVATRDSFKLTGDAFDFNIAPKNVTLVHVINRIAERQGKNVSLMFVGVPGEEVTLNGDLAKRYDISGSKFYQEYHEADILMEKAQNEMTELNTACQARLAKGEKQDSVEAYYNSKAPELAAKYKNVIFDFVKSHPSYEASASLIDNFEDADDMHKLLNLLSPEVKNGRMKEFLSYFVKGAEAQKVRQENATKAQAVGADAHDFTLNDIHGKPLTLSSLRGKYVILDFWGSWCGWCIKGMPQMKEYYAKYKGKFEILGVDCSDTEANWKAAVAKNQLPWLHVANGTGNNDVTSSYGIQGFPTKILVDPQGKIVKVIVGEDPSFYTYLDGLFGKK